MLKSHFDRRSMVEQAHERLLQMLDEQNQQEKGGKLPSERILASQLGVSRPTLREALRLLEEEGRIVRHPGLGTFISSGEEFVIESGLEQLTSFTEMMMRAGYKSGSKVLSIKEDKLLAEEAEALKVEPGGSKLVIRRIRFLNDVPANYSEHIVPTSLVNSLTEAEMQGSIFMAIEQHTGIKLAHAKTEVYPAHAGEEVGAHLNLDEDALLLVLDEVIYNVATTPVMLALSYFRPDLHHYHILRWRPGLERR